MQELRLFSPFLYPFLNNLPKKETRLNKLLNTLNFHKVIFTFVNKKESNT